MQKERTKKASASNMETNSNGFFNSKIVYMQLLKWGWVWDVRNSKKVLFGFMSKVGFHEKKMIIFIS